MQIGTVFHSMGLCVLSGRSHWNRLIWRNINYIIYVHALHLCAEWINWFNLYVFRFCFFLVLQIVKKDRLIVVVETSQACLKTRTCLVFMALLEQRLNLLLWTIYAMMETTYQRSVVGVANGQVDSPLAASVNKHYYAIDPGQLLV